MLSLSFHIVSSYHPNGRFNWSALSKLQAVGIEVLTALAEIKDQDCKRTQRYRDFKICPIAYTESGIDKVLHEGDFSDWLSNKIVPRTWRSLYNVLRELDYGEELSQQIESYLCGE